jgi:redox-sensing transcriptional repressor
MADQISELTINRLSLYLRLLNELEVKGIETVSSKELAQAVGLNAALIRKDLAHFGDLGIRGLGYVVKDLQRELRSILGLDRKLKVAIIGAGNLGLALADYPGFRKEGFQIVALFDNFPSKVGRESRRGVPIYDIRELKNTAQREGITIVAIAVPEKSAQNVVDTVVEAGVRAVLNFSPGTLRVPENVKLKSVDLTVSLEGLSFYLARDSRNEGG